MVVGDLDLGGSAGGPDEADAVLVVDPDGVLALAVASQLFEPVTGWHPQVVDRVGRVEQAQLLLRCTLKVWAEPAYVLACPDLPGLLVSERLDHSTDTTAMR